jgi:hypothetical protein
MQEQSASMALLRAMHFRGSEIQLGRVLHVVCQDPVVAHAFLEAVRRSLQPKGFRFGIPVDVRSRDEVRLFAVNSAQRTRRRARELGRVDLSFVGSKDFRLHVELKINAKFRVGQVQDYAESGAQVLAVVRDPETALNDVGHTAPGWLGACSWSAIANDLRDLPITDLRTKALWVDLIDVFEDAGDFAKSTRRQTARSSVELLENVHPHVAEYLQGRIRRKYRRDIGEVMRWKPARAGRHWAFLDLHQIGTNDLVLEIGLREGNTPNPVISVHWTRRRTNKLDEVQRWLLDHSWEQTRYGFKIEALAALDPTGTPETRTRQTADKVIRSLDGLIRCGAFDWDLRRTPTSNRR